MSKYGDENVTALELVEKSVFEELERLGCSL